LEIIFTRYCRILNKTLFIKLTMPENLKNLQPGEWISVGNAIIKKQAVVCRAITAPELKKIEGDFEVVYLDDRNRAINTGVIWQEDHWGFKNSGCGGGYADRYDRLRNYVNILRQGK